MINNYVIESVDYMLPPDIEIYEYEIYYNNEEIWRDIYFIENGVEYDYTGLYQVSTHGNVKGLKRKIKTKNNGYRDCDERILKLDNYNGYDKIDLCKNGIYKRFRVHRLVAHMFVSGYFDGALVNHKDENKSNNHFSNLEWCDNEYNSRYGTIGERMSKIRKENYYITGTNISTSEKIKVKKISDLLELGFDKDDVKMINDCLIIKDDKGIIKRIYFTQDGTKKERIYDYRNMKKVYKNYYWKYS